MTDSELLQEEIDAMVQAGILIATVGDGDTLYFLAEDINNAISEQPRS